MIYQVKIRSKAKLDLLKFAEFYENVRTGFGLKFIEIFEANVKLLESFPYRGFKRYKDFREFKIRKFPILIVYKIIENEIVIFSLFHTSQNPIKKYRS